MHKIIWLIFLSIAQLSPAYAESYTPIVLELFTSQSCSSCPPADKILGDLADENDNIIALSCNVTYWNHLQWQDTLSKKFCTQRQHDYVKTLQSRGSYTPQLIINGRHEMLGSRRGDIEKNISSDLKNDAVKPINLTLSKNNLAIILPQIIGDNTYTVSLITYGAPHIQKISSGENRGRTVNYTNPVQQIITLGIWDGKEKTINNDVSNIKNIDGYVVLVQKDSPTGTIIAAGKLKR